MFASSSLETNKHFNSLKIELFFFTLPTLFQAAKRGTSSTHVLQGSKTSVGEAKAPITVMNETGHDVTFTPCSNWHELDFVDSRHSLRSSMRLQTRTG